VAANFIDKLFGRWSRLPAQVQEALAQLTRLIKERPALAGPAHFLHDALPGLYAEPIPREFPVISEEQALAKLAQGVPLLRGEQLPLSLDAFARRWHHVCIALRRHQDGPAVRAVAQAHRRGVLNADQLTMRLLNGQTEAIPMLADEAGLDAGLLASVLRLTLFPLLSQVHLVLAPLHPNRWDHGYCPTCGSWPLLGEFRGLEQTRILRCGWCAAEWEVPRLCCPYCAATDHRQLGYFHVEDQGGKHRATTCDVCRGYVKMISSLSAFSPPGLLVMDLTTMDLDLIAAERGYFPHPVTKRDG
jgi:FdhE protein